MLDYIIPLMDDSNDFSWGAANASHMVLLCKMERGGGGGGDKRLQSNY